MAQQQNDGTWIMNDKDPIFFISAAQAAAREQAQDDAEDGDAEETAAILADPDAMQAIAEGERSLPVDTGRKRTWDDFLNVAEAEQEPVDPQLLLGKGPHIGDATSRVINGVSLLYRVHRVETNEFGHSYVTLTLLPDVLGHPPYEDVARDPSTGKCTWSNGEPVVFTSGQNNELALKATRLDTLHKVLRAKYFHYEAMAEKPVVTNSDAGSRIIARAIRDEYAEQLFLLETGLRYDQAAEKYEEFYEALHDEFLASQEQ